MKEFFQILIVIVFVVGGFVTIIQFAQNIYQESAELKQQRYFNCLGKVDKEKQRISLSLKQATQDPWLKEIPEKFAVGSAVNCKIVKMADFGIFVELSEGVEGLIHVSESGVEPPVRAEDVMKIGDEVWARVTKIDTVDKKIALSIKEYKKDLDRAEIAEYMENQAKGGNTLGEVARKITSE
mgnify:CR=1 FL=1